LAKFETPKEKIKHLTGLLTDVGMTPRYSNEKAKKIKEERELQAEVEAVQEGAGWAKMDNGRANTRSTRSAPTVSTAEKKVHPIPFSSSHGQILTLSTANSWDGRSRFP